MPRSWNHAIEPRKPEDGYALCRCSRAKCKARWTYATSYSYVTGRGGRVTTRRQQLCIAHARDFANRHGLAMPPETCDACGGAGFLLPDNGCPEIPGRVFVERCDACAHYDGDLAAAQAAAPLAAWSPCDWCHTEHATIPTPPWRAVPQAGQGAQHANPR